MSWIFSFISLVMVVFSVILIYSTNRNFKVINLMNKASEHFNKASHYYLTNNSKEGEEFYNKGKEFYNKGLRLHEKKWYQI